MPAERQGRSCLCTLPVTLGSQFGSPEKNQDVTAAAAHECSAVKYSRSAHFQSSVHLSANRPSTSATKEASTSIEGEKGQNLS